MAYGTKGFVAVGQGVNTVAYSLDGTMWTGLGTTIFGTRGTAVAFGNGIYLASGLPTAFASGGSAPALSLLNTSIFVGGSARSLVWGGSYNCEQTKQKKQKTIVSDLLQIGLLSALTAE